MGSITKVYLPLLFMLSITASANTILERRCWQVHGMLTGMASVMNYTVDLRQDVINATHEDRPSVKLLALPIKFAGIEMGKLGSEFSYLGCQNYFK